jgi:ferrochelatase
MTNTRRRRVTVLCMTYGEPASNDWRPQFNYSLSILNRLTRRVAPIPRFVTPLLAARRGRIRSQTFNEMGYHSPLDAISAAQAAAIARHLAAMHPDTDFDVRVVMEFCAPYIWTHLDEIRRDPPDELLILPLYVAESDFTTGVSRTDLVRYHADTRGRHGLPKPAYVGGFGFDDRLGKLLADFVLEKCRAAGWTEEQMAASALILGAHGTLQFPPPGINSGARETLYLFGLVRRHLRRHFRTVRVGWLNHTLGGKWTFPAVDETGTECWEQGIRRIVYFPFGFMGDNNESQNEGREALKKFEWESLLYLPCPNDDEAFCRYLALKVSERLADPMREEWHALACGGRSDLIQRERPARRGEPGALTLSGPALAVVALLFWTAVGALLVGRGLAVAGSIDSPVMLATAGLMATLIGWYKGVNIIGRVVRRSLVRLRRIPQPSPIWDVFSRPVWIMIAFFSVLGMSLRLVPMPTGLYAGIILGVGLAMLVGAAIGIVNFRESIPREILSLRDPRPPRRPRVAEAQPQQG